MDVVEKCFGHAVKGNSGFTLKEFNEVAGSWAPQMTWAEFSGEEEWLAGGMREKDVYETEEVKIIPGTS